MSELPEDVITRTDEDDRKDLVTLRYLYHAAIGHCDTIEDIECDMRKIYDSLSSHAKEEARKIYNFDWRLIDWLEQFNH
jgi:hypothetical protein